MSKTKGSLVFLPRGGILISTSAGNIQLGIPPETIKDTMKLEGGVPGTFIIPQSMFDLHCGIALAEMEFPVYYNFFFRKGKTRIICNEGQRKRIETVISEALFGPERIDHVHEFALGENTPGFPNLRAEMDYFRKSMRSDGRATLEDLIDFCVVDDSGRAAFEGMTVKFDRHGNLTISEKGKKIAFIGRETPVMIRRSVPAQARLNFQPPLFGVTTLGAGHGFDPNADTSGLIIWVNRRGVMVDPPVNSTEKLVALGVSPKWIDNIILTHCHADHDAGTLQKILQEGKVNLYTTHTIYKSFMKKAEALTGVEISRLKKMVHFYPVCIGKPMIIGGGRFNFNYTLHTIPTISIQASLYEKSMIYSSDTMNDPQFINQLHAEGVLTQDRRDFLINFPWDQDVVFHEAGIPPIHTPMSYLCSLPASVRKRMFLVHVNPDMIPGECGLRIAPTGLANTVAFDIHDMPHQEAIEMLDVFSRVELFEHLTLEKAREFLLVARVEAYQASDIIFNKGDRGDKFYVVMSGEIDIVLDGKVITTYDAGGYFGEKSLFLDENRTAAAKAKTDARLLSIRKDEMLSLIRGTESESLLRQIADFQNVDVRDTLRHNPILDALTATQRTRLHGLIRPYPRLFHPGEVIADKGSVAKFTYIVREGSVAVYRGRVLVDTLAKGGLFGVKDVFNKRKGKKIFSFIAQEETWLYTIEHADLERYIDNNPGVYIKIYHFLY